MGTVSCILMAAFLNVTPCAARVPFDNAIIDKGAHGHRIVCDVDGDGKNDILLANLEDHRIAWYRFPDWRKTTAVDIGKYADYKHYRSCGFAAADVDGDGDTDALGRIGHMDDKTALVVWWENPRPDGDPGRQPWPRHDIGRTEYLKNIAVADFDRDGKPDVAGREHTRTHILLQKGPGSWEKVKSIEHDSHEGMVVGDLDRDGDPDVLLNGFWLENPFPKSVADTWTNHNIDDKWHTQRGQGWKDNNCNIALADINRDGLLDPLFAHSELPGYPVSWYTAKDPRAGPWTEHVIETVYDYCQTMDAADVDNDGDVDVLAADFARYGKGPWPVTLYLNNGTRGGGDGTRWVRQDLAQTGCYGAVFGDLGSDGDIDVVGNREYQSPGAPSIEVWENKTSDSRLSLDKWTYIEVDDSRTRHGGRTRGGSAWFGLAMGDLDGDGDKDIVSGQWFYRNPGGDMMGKWDRVTVQEGTDNLLVVDVDGDEFGDFIGANNEAQFWFEAADARATSWMARQIGALPVSSHGVAPQGFNLAQIVPGGRPEILLCSQGIYYLQIPDDPERRPWRSVMVQESGCGGEEVVASDIDGDGDLDICASVQQRPAPNEKPKGIGVCWWENPGDGSGNWERHLVGTTVGWADRFGVADINGDGRQDIVVSEETRLTDAHLFWFEQPDDATRQDWRRHLVVRQFTMNSMEIADMDRDGDTDIIVNEHRGDKRLQIWENDGRGSFTEHLIDQGKEGHLGGQVADMDSDGDLDILSICWDDYRYLHLWRNDNGRGPAPVGEARAPGARPTERVGPARGGDLVLHWPFDEADGTAVADASAYKNDGIVRAGTWTRGRTDGALRFDGRSTYVSPARAVLQGAFPASRSDPARSFTVAAWVRLNSTGHRNPIAGRQGNQQRGFMFMTEQDDRLTLELFKNASVNTTVSSGKALQAGIWYHVAVTCQYARGGASKVRLYIDGQVDGSSDAAVGPVNTNATPFEVGRYYWSPAYSVYFDGIIDEVRVYSRALTEAEVQKLAAPILDGQP